MQLPGKPSFFESLKEFSQKRGQLILFTCIFYSFWVLFWYINKQDFELKTFAGRMIGRATLEGSDVAVRVAMFYKSSGLFFLAIILFGISGFFLDRKFPHLLRSAEARAINYSSLAGIFIFLFRLFGYPSENTLEMIYLLQKFLLAGLLFRIWGIRFTRTNYTVVLGSSIALYFFIADIACLSGQKKNPDFFLTTFLIAIFFLLLLFLALKRNPDNRRQLWHKLLCIALTLTFLPVVSVLKDEIYFILRTNGIVLASQLIPFLAIILLMGIYIYWRYKRPGNAIKKSENELLALRFVPFLVFSVIFFYGYSYYVKYSEELYESANNYLPVMELKLFGIIPVIEKLSGHLLSGYFFMLIYTMLNGLTGLDIILYDFMLLPVSLTLLYLLVYYVSRNTYISFFAILLFPFATVIVSIGFCISILGLIALKKVILHPPSYGNYLLLFFTMTFLMFWRIDVGVSCLCAIPIILLWYNYSDPQNKIVWPRLLYALLTVAGSLVLFIGLLSLYRGTNLFYRFLYAFYYCTSAQSFGYGSIYKDNLIQYLMQYIVFPGVAGLILLALLLCFGRLNKSRKAKVAYLSLLFVCLLYFANFNRGMIRHSLSEGVDDFTSAFSYFIFSAAVFVFLRKNSQVFQFIAFIGISFIGVLSYGFPYAKGREILLESAIEKIITTRHIPLTEVKRRFTDYPAIPLERYQPFIDFMNENLRKDETFLDFTNHGLLYYFVRKETPSYFYHNPFNSHNDFLQLRFLEDIQKYKTPYLSFAEMNSLGFDFFDDVPNQVRHYRIAEYYNQHYKPYIIAGKICIWRRNDIKDMNRIDTLLKMKPYATGALEFNMKRGKKYLLRVTGDTSKHILHTVPGIRIAAENGTLTPEFYHTSTREAYAIIGAKGHECRIWDTESNNTVTGLLILECDHIPDFYSTKPLEIPLQQLPCVWGEFDKKLPHEEVLVEKLVRGDSVNSSLLTMAVPGDIDKSAGNTVIITCRNSGKTSMQLELSLGNGNPDARSRFYFDVLPSAEEKRYAIRISSLYNWYLPTASDIKVHNKTDGEVCISSIRITRGS